LALLPAGRPAPSRAPPRAIDYSYGLILFKAPAAIQSALRLTPRVSGLLRDHLERLNVPILGGLPLGHGTEPHSVPIGAVATLDASSGDLAITIGA
jgi:muramoyltetrapeptide carboxypeptidase LdcA involved in peptidoglycan recycling